MYALFCSKQDFSLITTVNINSLAYILIYRLYIGEKVSDTITDVSVVCCLSVLALQTKTSRFGNEINLGLLKLKFQLTIYFRHGVK